MIRVVRNRQNRDDYYDDGYDEPRPRERVVYETVQPRRKHVVRRPSPTEYVYEDDEIPAPVVRVRARSRPRPEVVYVDDDYEQDYIYVDENGNEVEIVDDRDHDYVYEDDYERDRRRHRQPKVVYVADDDRRVRRPRKTLPTRIVYE